MIGKPTIFAVSSGTGRAGIAVVRLSGPSASAALVKLSGSLPPERKAVLRTLYSRSDRRILDQAMVVWFPGPRSVTGEDVAELHLHGSPAVVTAVLEELSAFENCRPAEPGEFTLRAFENERMDLVEVEGLADLLAASTEGQRRLAMRQFSGEASSVYEAWNADIAGALAIIEAAIDFADEDDVAAQAIALARPRLLLFLRRLELALAESERASLVRRGLRIVIAGAPNVGKSSLMNALAGRRVAIVSDIAGTTRDVVEAPMVINGLPVSLADTAGVRSETSDVIECEGIARTLDEVASADILVWVVTAGDVAPALPPRAADILVMNKSDLVSRESIQLRNDSDITLSTKTGLGVDDLRQRLAGLVDEKTSVSDSAVMVRARHKTAVQNSIRFLNDALSKPDDALELMAEDVRNAATALAGITGRVGVEDFLGRIFSEFCIGK
jgi:tRNA modification GTPase